MWISSSAYPDAAANAASATSAGLMDGHFFATLPVGTPKSTIHILY
jgi:hypothetical protein